MVGDSCEWIIQSPSAPSAVGPVLELPTFLLLKLLLPRHRCPGFQALMHWSARALVFLGRFADIPVTCSYVAFLYMLPSAISDILWIRVAYDWRSKPLPPSPASGLPAPSCTIPADLQQSLSNVSYGLLTHFYCLEN